MPLGTGWLPEPTLTVELLQAAAARQEAATTSHQNGRRMTDFPSLISSLVTEDYIIIKYLPFESKRDRVTIRMSNSAIVCEPDRPTGYPQRQLPVSFANRYLCHVLVRQSLVAVDAYDSLWDPI